MSWYDTFASFYDASVERVYQVYRAEIVRALELEPGQRVLDLACGTGPNLPHLREAVGPEGSVFGLEPSAGMAARARSRDGHEAQILERTALDPGLAGAIGQPLDAIVVTLGLSVIPEPVENVRALLPLLKPNGRFVAFDVHAESWVPQTTWVELIARADLDRHPERTLKQAGLETTCRRLDGSPWIHGGHVFLAVGRLPARGGPGMA